MYIVNDRPKYLDLSLQCPKICYFFTTAAVFLYTPAQSSGSGCLRPWPRLPPARSRTCRRQVRRSGAPRRCMLRCIRIPAPSRARSQRRILLGTWYSILSAPAPRAPRVARLSQYLRRNRRARLQRCPTCRAVYPSTEGAVAGICVLANRTGAGVLQGVVTCCRCGTRQVLYLFYTID